LSRLVICSSLRQGVVSRPCVTPLLYTRNRGFSEDNSEDNSKHKHKDEAKDKLSSLLSGLKTTGRKSPGRELNLAKPNKARPVKRTKDGTPMLGSVDTRNLDKDVVEGAREAAKLAKGERKKLRTESDLLKKLVGIKEQSESAKKEDTVLGEKLDLSSLFSDIKVEKTEKKAKQYTDKEDRKKDLTMEQQAFLMKRQKLRRQQQSQSDQHTPVDLFGGTPLGIFTGPLPPKETYGALTTWKACVARELRIMSTPSPRNALEEMMLWTDQGKLWHFPVDNEQGLDYSDDPFHKHVFLEHHLESWCPKTGPVRHFMELVCIGMSKNPYISSSKKLETIHWFKDYFEREDNLDLLIHGGYWEEQQSLPN